MRFTKSLLCAAVAVSAQYYDDDDLSMLRSLNANDSNATTVTPTTTTAAANTTVTPTTTTAAATTTTAAATTTTAAATTTTAAAEEQVIGGAPQAVSRAVNETNDTTTVDMVLSTEIKVTLPASTVALATATVSSRRLRRLSAAKVAAYNMMCSAYSLNSALLQCGGLKNAGQIPDGIDTAGWTAGTYLFPSLDHCMPAITEQIAGTNCNSATQNADNSYGHCIKNIGGGAGGLTKHTACTQHELVSGSEYKYKTSTSMSFPAAQVSTSAATAITTAKTASQAAVTDTATAQRLQLYLVVAAVAIAANPAAAAEVNMTEAFGLSDAQVSAASTALAGGVTAAVAATTPAAALSTATAALVASNPSLDTATLVANTVNTSPAPNAGTTGTSGAVQMGAFATIVLALSAMLF